MEIIAKDKAKNLNLKRYFTGVPCSKGHIAERTVSRGDCVDCLYERQRKWGKRNANKINEKSKQWYLDNPEKAKATRADWRDKNYAKCRADVAAYQLAHKEELRASQVIYQNNNKEKIIIRRSAWVKNNRHKLNAQKTKRDSVKLNATPMWANKFFIEEIYDLALRRTKATGFKWHVDHIVPLRSKIVQGLHVEHNLQVIPAVKNLHKGNRYWPNMPN